MNSNVRRKGLLLPLAIVLLGSWLRLYQISITQPFHIDVSRDAYQTRSILKAGNWPLVGPTTSIGDIHLGPAYYYVMSPWLALFNYHPVGLAVGMVFFNVVAMILVYITAEKMFSRNSALWSLLIYSLSFVAVNQARFAWNPNLMPLISILLVYCLYQLLISKRGKYITWALILLGLSWHIHYLGIIWVVPILWASVTSYKSTDNTKDWWKWIGIGIGGILVLTAPFLIYNSNHNYIDWHKLRYLLSENSFDWKQSFTNILYGIRMSVGGVLGMHPVSWFRWMITGMVMVGFIRLWKGADNKHAYKLIGYMWLAAILSIGLLPGPIFPHYLTTVWPLAAIAFGVVASHYLTANSIPKNGVVMGGLLVLLLCNYPHYSFRDPFSFTVDDYAKISATIVDRIDDKKYFLYGKNTDGDYLAIGYRYFIEEMDSGLMDPYLVDEVRKIVLIVENSTGLLMEDSIEFTEPGTSSNLGIFGIVDLFTYKDRTVYMLER